MPFPSGQEAPFSRFLSRLPLGVAWRRALWGLVIFGLVWALLAWDLVPRRLDLQAGQVAPRDIEAPRDAIDRPETERLREEAAARVSPQYEEDPAVAPAVDQAIAAAFKRIREARRDQETEAAARVDALKTDLGLEVLEATYYSLLNAEDGVIDDLETASRQVMARVYSRGVKEDRGSIDLAEEQIRAEVENLAFRREFKTFLLALNRRVLEPNFFFSEAETERRRQEARQQVEPVRIPKGKVVVRKGDVVTQDDIRRLEDLGLLRTQRDYRTVFGAGLISALLLSVVALYGVFFQRKLWQSESAILVFGAILVLTLFSAKVLSPVSGFLIPVAAGGMLVTSLLDGRLGLLLAMVAGVLVGIIAGDGFTVTLVAVIGGMVGVYAVARIGQRFDVTRAGILVGAANALTIVALAMVGGRTLADLELWVDVGWGLASGLLAAVLTMGSLTPFETFFGIITPVKLLELANPNHPLLRKLLMEAPGSYHHSILVANLTEAAVETLGGDSLLARVGVYYHDLGKTRRPYFFVENQLAGENPHEKISPHLSALIIKSHVKDGVELAEAHRLPPRIIDFIREHHGTTLVGYFYARAAEDKPAEHIPEEDFRYDGPRPQSKETAVCMLADACEAAVRTLVKPSPGRIEAMVRKIIKDRLNDGQLDEADLTFRDLDVIARTFTSILTGVFHARVEYPEHVLHEIREVKRQQAQLKRKNGRAAANPTARREGGAR